MRFKIAGKDFYEYLTYRLKKDKLGFVPCEERRDGSTRPKVFIQAPMAQCAVDFMVYAHELGHNKAHQQEELSRNFTFSYGVSDESLYNEYQAWQWALRYMRKLKILPAISTVTEEVSKWFGSYTRNAKNTPLANSYIEKLNNLFGTSMPLELEEKRLSTGEGNCYTLTLNMLPIIGPFSFDRPSSVLIAKRPKKDPKRKPWMDMVDKANKRHRRHAGKWA